MAKMIILKPGEKGQKQEHVSVINKLQDNIKNLKQNIEKYDIMVKGLKKWLIISWSLNVLFIIGSIILYSHIHG